MKDWTEIIDIWINKRISFRQYRDDIVLLFKIALENTLLPEKSWFGFPSSMSSLSIIFGHIYLVGITLDRKIWMVIDADIDNEIGFETSIVKSSKQGEHSLYWLEINFDMIKTLIANETIWRHYRIASLKVNSSSNIRSERKDWLTGKYLVKDIFFGQQRDIELHTVEQIFEKELKFSKNDNQQKRQERLKQADKKPASTSTQARVFLRNADVVVEVLQRANGYCEYCKTPAPFQRDSNGEDYLEVHHIVPLAENGDDTIENAVALCPNCHRQAHYGKKNFDIERFEKKSCL